MAALEDALQDGDLTRILLYGDAKMRKTWWATRIAELGFNVILCDIDYGFHVTKNLAPEVRKRIFHVDMRAPIDSFKNCGAMTLSWAMTGQVTFYDETERKYARKASIQAEREYVKFDTSRFTSKDVLIVDSWTMLCQHLALADMGVTDPTQVAKLEWDDYQKIRLALDMLISNMMRMNCHIIVIGHAEDWAKRKADAPVKAKPEDAIESIKRQPMSISKPHASTMAKNFTDVLYFSAPNAMLGVQISTKGSDDFAAGSRSIAPGSWKWDDVSFTKFVPQKMLDAVKNNETYSSEAVTMVKGEDALVKPAADAAIPVTGKPTGILNLANRKNT